MKSANDTQDGDGSPPELQPVFDPELPDEDTATLANSPEKLLSADDTPKSTEPLSTGTRVALGVLGLVATTTASALALLWATSLGPMVAGLSILLCVGAVVAAFRRGNWLLGGVAILLSSGTVIFAEEIGAPPGSALATGTTALLGLLVTIALVTDNPADRLPSLHHGRYVIPDDLGDRERALLLRAQQARRRVEENEEHLGDVFDATHALMVLREQEWSLARLLLKQSRLRADLEERDREAPSDNVRASLRPQFDAIAASEEAARRRVEGIEDYAAKIAHALTAQREWELVERNVAKHHEYGELLAEATTEAPGTDHLEDDAELRAVREIRDARISEALEAGRWLSEAADPG